MIAKLRRQLDEPSRPPPPEAADAEDALTLCQGHDLRRLQLHGLARELRREGSTSDCSLLAPRALNG